MAAFFLTTFFLRNTRRLAYFVLLAFIVLPSLLASCEAQARSKMKDEQDHTKEIKYALYNYIYYKSSDLPILFSAITTCAQASLVLKEK